jgi:hypothetical protein
LTGRLADRPASKLVLLSRSAAGAAVSKPESLKMIGNNLESAQRRGISRTSPVE